MSKTRDDKTHSGKMHYGRLLWMTVLSFISMYVLMYAMVDRFANVYTNFNQSYMAGLMTAPMVLIELAVMGAMYPDRKKNFAIGAAAVIALVAFWILIRQQTAISDQQLLRSMIPHHAGAVLMCEQAPLQDPQLKELCRTIISNQKAEIDQMKAKLSELDR